MSTRKSLSNKADKLWRNYIHERDKGRCQYCGQDGNNAHHIIGRRNHRTRWEPDNGLLLCSGDHTFRTSSFHQDPLATMNWFKEHYPDRYEHLMSIRNELWDKDYEKIFKQLGG